jgi:uncharacterized protein (DUF608 family)
MALGIGREYSGEALNQIAFPLGGLGAGCLHIGGQGQLRDFCLFNVPGLGNCPMTFASLFCEDDTGRSSFRVLEAPVPAGDIFTHGRFGNGLLRSGHEGLPHMERATFKAAFPFAEVTLTDPAMPVTVELSGWSPFVPRDPDTSGLPAAFLSYTVNNRRKVPLRIQFAFNAQYPIAERGEHPTVTHRRSGQAHGLQFTSGLSPDAANYATISVASPLRDGKANCAWFRGGWFDALSVLAGDLSCGTLRAARQQKDGPGTSQRFGATLFWDLELGPQQKIEIPLVYTWHTPNSDFSFALDENSCMGVDHERTYQPYYRHRFDDAWAVARTAIRQHDHLKEESERFSRALYGSTLPAEVLDAVGSNLAILKSPTVMRQSDGSLWCWEGCLPGAGCCPGSCTHVWNYAQAIPYLFPQLERTLRDQEFKWSMNESGHVTYRAALPTATVNHDFHSAADGQLGGIIKLYRDWQISGDDTWLAERFPAARLSLDYCINTWDPDRTGTLVEPHHNTYDIEFWAPDIMCTGIYLAALEAFNAMARHLGEHELAADYEILLESGKTACEALLWNGEYYQQSTDWRNTRAASELDKWTGAEGRLNDGAYSAEAMKLVKKEGPKYQYGNGCLADGLIGQWFAWLYDLPEVLPPARISKHLDAVYRHNFRTRLDNHVNPQRPGYALGSDPGLLICTWPRGGQPSLPFVYSNEVWTGIEYQVASSLIFDGQPEKGLEIVRAARSRYDGRARNPFNEYECGNYYARALASYALLTAMTGFRYSAVEKQLSLSPVGARKGKCFFSTDAAWGVVHYNLATRRLRIEILGGSLQIRSVEVRDRETGQVYAATPEPALVTRDDATIKLTPV